MTIEKQCPIPQLVGMTAVRQCANSARHPASAMQPSVMAGHSRPKDGVLSHAYVPATHVLALVMAGLVPAIHVFAVARPQDVDARDKRGHDGGETGHDDVRHR